MGSPSSIEKFHTYTIETTDDLENFFSRIGGYEKSIIEQQEDGSLKIYNPDDPETIGIIPANKVDMISKRFEQKYFLELTNLQLDALRNNIATQQWNNVEQKINELITKYQNFINNAKIKKGKGISGKKTLINIKENAKQILKELENQAENLNSYDKTIPVPKTLIDDLNEYENLLADLNEDFARALSGEYPYRTYKTPKNIHQAKRQGRKLKLNARYLNRLKDILYRDTFLIQNNFNIESFIDYLKKIQRGETSQPFEIKNPEIYNYLLNGYGELTQYITLSKELTGQPKPVITQKTLQKYFQPEQNPNVYYTAQPSYPSTYPTQKDSYTQQIETRKRYNSPQEAFQDGNIVAGLQGLIERHKTLPERKKEFYKGLIGAIGTLAPLAIAGFTIFQLGRALFGKKEKRGKAAKIFFSILGVQAVVDLGFGGWKNLGKKLFSSILSTTGSATGVETGREQQSGVPNLSEFYPDDIDETEPFTLQYIYGYPRIASYFAGLSLADVKNFVTINPADNTITMTNDQINLLIEKFKQKGRYDIVEDLQKLKTIPEPQRTKLIDTAFEGMTNSGGQAVKTELLKDSPTGNMDDYIKAIQERNNLLYEYMKEAEVELKQSDNTNEMLQKYFKGEINLDDLINNKSIWESKDETKLYDKDGNPIPGTETYTQAILEQHLQMKEGRNTQLKILNFEANQDTSLADSDAIIAKRIEIYGALDQLFAQYGEYISKIDIAPEQEKDSTGAVKKEKLNLKITWKGSSNTTNTEIIVRDREGNAPYIENLYDNQGNILKFQNYEEAIFGAFFLQKAKNEIIKNGLTQKNSAFGWYNWKTKINRWRNRFTSFHTPDGKFNWSKAGEAAINAIRAGTALFVPEIGIPLATTMLGTQAAYNGYKFINVAELNKDNIGIRAFKKISEEQIQLLPLLIEKDYKISPTLYKNPASIIAYLTESLPSS